MIGIFILLLTGLFFIAVTYGLFWFCFKTIWTIRKKNGNKGPLIWAGVSTCAFWLLMGGLTAWGVYRIVTPFRPLMQRIQDDPQPRYGLTAYTDPEYNFSLQLPDGVDFSEWIHFSGVKTKLGINTNVFKKQAADDRITDPVVISAIFRQSNDIDDENPFREIEQAIATQDPSFNIKYHGPQTVGGLPGYFAEGEVYTNQGAVPFWAKSVYKDQAIISILTTTLNSTDEGANQVAKDLANSLQIP